ncbi:MAG: S-methyl-5-thioribose-1-phosphate isomerase [Bdellovibrionales bacterium]
MTPFISTGLKLDSQGLWVLDQTQLPQREMWLASPDVPTMIGIIRELKTRGAPLIGVAAALQLGLMVEQGTNEKEFERALWALREARPTAVNLMNSMDRLLRVAREKGLAHVPAEAERICFEDVKLSEGMARNGAKLIQDGDRILTHCNTGGLATVGLGTALGVIIQAVRDGKSVHAYVDETRPLLQGARLTTWECTKNQIPFTLICDNMAGFLMQKGRVSKVMTGADRIARNGDFANKVGTYSLAVLCRHHGIPFYVVAPQTTVDLSCASGNDIPIEERSAHEVRGVAGAFGRVEWSVGDSPVWNPAFDVTPAELVTGWILDHGVYSRDDINKGVLFPN